VLRGKDVTENTQKNLIKGVFTIDFRLRRMSQMKKIETRQNGSKTFDEDIFLSECYLIMDMYNNSNAQKFKDKISTLEEKITSKARLSIPIF